MAIELISLTKSLGYKSVDWEYAKEYRDCNRVVVMAEALANSLWKIASKVLDLADLIDVKPYGFDNQGIWVPVGVNPCIRFTEYNKGGHFSTHKDGAFVVDDDNRSILTLQIYLNDDFRGGETIFYERDLRDKKSEDEELQNATIAPKKCRMVIFSHDIDHEGKEVLEGTKYILRTDIMFKRVFNPKPQERELLTCNPEFLKCDKLYQMSPLLYSVNLMQGFTPTGTHIP